MHLKLLRTAARVAIFGGIVTLGLGTTQAALAVTKPTIVMVPCSTSALITDMTNPVTDTILMLAPNCTYTLTAAYDVTSLGLPAVMKAVTIVGSANTWIKRSTVVETPDFGIFGVGCTTGNLTLDSVNVANGGGSDYDVDGGAVDVMSGSATINGGTFTGNSVDATAGPDEAYGGAIYSDGTLTVNVATFTDNGAYDGGAIYTESPEPTLKGDTFKDNTASEDGGAVYNADVTTVTGGAFTGNSAVNGGALYNTGNAMVDEDTFSQNSASGDGGAIDNAGTMTVSHGIISKNTATDDGGGIYNADTHALTVDTSQITSNTAGANGGGGIYNADGTVTVSGGLISGNNPENCEPLNSISGCSD
jgi:predicted outer membrane repeat protein